MNALFEGVVLGLTLAFVFGFGPAFFALIQTTLHRGLKAGILLALGIFLNDVMVVALALIGSVSLMPNSDNYKLLGIIGGGLLVVFGIVTLTRKVSSVGPEDDVNNNPPAIIYIGKGFLLNLANPFVWLFWLSVVVSATVSYKSDTYELVVFFASALAMIIITDALKVFMASRLKNFANDKFLAVINNLAGIGLILFGLFLVGRVVFGF